MTGRDVLERGGRGTVFAHPAMDFAATWLLGYSQQGALSPGALLATFAQIRSGSPASWVRAFTCLATATHLRALAAEQDGGDGEASEAWLGVAVAERARLMMLDPRSAVAHAATEAMSAAFTQHMRLAQLPLVRWPVPLGPARLPAYLSVDAASAPAVLVVVGGGDTYVEDLWFFGGRAAMGRGWPVLLVDLPGQGSTPYQGLHFGAATLDGLAAALAQLRHEGFGGDVVLLGWSGGGIVVTRYVSQRRPEDRLRAWIASTPVHDAPRLVTRAMPALLRRRTSLALLAARLAAVDRVQRIAVRKYEWQFGPGGLPHLLEALAAAATDLTAVDVPLLALVGTSEDPELRRQAQEVIDAVRAEHPESALLTFDSASGADAHCQVGNLPLALARAFDWLDAIGLGPPSVPH